MNIRALSALLALALAAIGCSSPEAEDDTSTVAAPPKPRDAWMAGSYSWSQKTDSESLHQDITLEEDGTGTWSFRTARHYIDYGMGNESSNYDVTWWSQDGKLVLDGTVTELVTTPNCRLVKMDDLVFTHRPRGACPHRIQPLTEMEAKAVGNWRFYEEGGPGESNEYLTLQIEADRNVYYHDSPHQSWMVDSGPSTHTSYFHIDSSNVLHGMNIDGREDFYVRLKPTNEGLSFCDLFREENCRPLTQQ